MIRFVGYVVRIGVSTFALGLAAYLSGAHASTVKVVYSFTGVPDGDSPDNGSPVMDANGNLYGTTAFGGDYGSGGVYKLAPDGTETVLHSFAEGADGYEPQAVVFDQHLDRYGVTCCGGDIGGGVIFEIASKQKERLLHTFEGAPSDGGLPCDSMVLDTNGNFYGTTFAGGKYDVGTVFKLTPGGNESLVYSFHGGHDGLYPFAGLTIDAQDNLYGTTDYGGKVSACSNGFGGCGTIFKLAPDGTKSLLYEFGGPPKDGFVPTGTLIFDESGNLYGTTEYGGRAGCNGGLGCGIVFELAPDGTEKFLHYFTGKHGDGGNPVAGLIADAAGNLYGTTEFGGGRNPCYGADGCGTIFAIAPDGTETILHKFKGTADGAGPAAGLVSDGKGDFFGTTGGGGEYGYGTVFEITP